MQTLPTLQKEQLSLVSSPLQKQRLDSIILLHSEWIEYANSLISTKKDTIPESNLKYQELFEKKVRKEVGKKLNDAIQLKFVAFDGDEYNLRYRRREVLQKSIDKTRQLTLGLTLFSIAIALLGCFYIVKRITSRIKKMVGLAEEISNGIFKKIEDDKNDELTQLSQSLNNMSATLDKNIKELNQFAYVVSHDLKAPLRGIDNITKWAEEDYAHELTPGMKKSIDLIKGRTHRLENMINGLLEYARIGIVKKNYEEVDVKVILNELCDLLVPPAFSVHYLSPLPKLVTEKLRLEQVFSNLLSNAVKHHQQPKGNISIDCKELASYYEFSVSDDGPGIQAEYHEKIFVIFQTLKERDAFESTGAGLAIVKKIIEEQQASISVESKPEQGTTIKFTWPKKPVK